MKLSEDDASESQSRVEVNRRETILVRSDPSIAISSDEYKQLQFSKRLSDPSVFMVFKDISLAATFLLLGVLSVSPYMSLPSHFWINLALFVVLTVFTYTVVIRAILKK